MHFLRAFIFIGLSSIIFFPFFFMLEFINWAELLY